MLPEDAESPPPPTSSSQASAAPAGKSAKGSQPWVLRLGNYLGGAPSEPSDGDDDDRGWAVRLGSYLSENQPGPWSIIANEKPQDPLVRRRAAASKCSPVVVCPSLAHALSCLSSITLQALRLGTFLNETKPIGLLHRNKASDSADDSTSPSKPLVLRLGDYLNGESSDAATASDAAASVAVPPSTIPSPSPPKASAAAHEPPTAAAVPVPAVEAPAPATPAADAVPFPEVQPEALPEQLPPETPQTPAAEGASAQ